MGFLTSDPIAEKIGSGIENIRVIENFVSPEDLVQLVDFCKSKEQKENPGRSYTVDPNPEIYYLRQKYSKKMVETVSEYYEDTSKLRSYDPSSKFQQASFLIYPEGSSLSPHVDTVGLTQEDRIEDPLNAWTGHLAAIIYLNDNYEGGEISFPDRGIDIKPKSGMLITFPGNKNYVHEVKEVISGTRLTLSIWIRFLEADKNPHYAWGIEE